MESVGGGAEQREVHADAVGRVGHASTAQPRQHEEHSATGPKGNIGRSREGLLEVRAAAGKEIRSVGCRRGVVVMPLGRAADLKVLANVEPVGCDQPGRRSQKRRKDGEGVDRLQVAQGPKVRPLGGAEEVSDGLSSHLRDPPHVARNAESRSRCWQLALALARRCQLRCAICFGTRLTRERGVSLNAVPCDTWVCLCVSAYMLVSARARSGCRFAGVRNM